MQVLKRLETVISKPQDFLQWMVDIARNEESGKEFIALIQLKLSFAAIHTSAAALNQILYDLCARPEYSKTSLQGVRILKLWTPYNPKLLVTSLGLCFNPDVTLNITVEP